MEKQLKYTQITKMAENGTFPIFINFQAHLSCICMKSTFSAPPTIGAKWSIFKGFAIVRGLFGGDLVAYNDFSATIHKANWISFMRIKSLSFYERREIFSDNALKSQALLVDEPENHTIIAVLTKLWASFYRWDEFLVDYLTSSFDFTAKGLLLFFSGLKIS